jgi:hypothetical protein
MAMTMATVAETTEATAATAATTATTRTGVIGICDDGDYGKSCDYDGNNTKAATTARRAQGRRLYLLIYLQVQVVWPPGPAGR